MDLHETGSVGLRVAKQMADDGYPVICLVNYEKVWQMGYKYVERVKRDGTKVKEHKKVDTAMEDITWDVGVLDESTAIKARGSKISRYVRAKLRAKTRYRAILTGSAYTKRPLDVWAQIMYVDPTILPMKFEDFAARYAVPHPQFRGQYISYVNIDHLVRQLAKCSVMLKKDDVAELPPMIHQTRLVTLSPRSKKIYNEIKEAMFVEFEMLEQAHKDEYDRLSKAYENETDDATAAELYEQIKKLKSTKAVTAEHVFARTRKWQQITSGFIIPDSDDPKKKAEPIRLGTEKIQELVEILEERDGAPTIIVVQLDEEEKIVAEAIEKHFGVTPKILNGSVKGGDKRHEMIEQALKEPFFIVKESVGCRGVDMRAADTTIFFSHRPMTEAFEQMISRSHRVGVKHKCITIIHILAKGTYDMKIMQILKSDLAQAKKLEDNWRELFTEVDEI